KKEIFQFLCFSFFYVIISTTSERNNYGGKFGTDPRFQILKRLFKIAGTPLFPEKESNLYILYRNVVVVSGYLTLLTTFIGIVQNITDLEYVLGAARVSFVMINLIWMHFFISFNIQKVRNLLNMIGHFTWSDLPLHDHEGSISMAGWIPKIQNLLWKFNFCDWGFHCLYLVLRGVSSGSYHPLFFDAWSPFNTENIMGYAVVLLIQGFGSVMIGTSLFAVMGLYISSVAVACTQLQKIQAALVNIKQKDETLLNDELILCIRHHQQVLRYIKLLEETFNPVLLGPFMSVVAALCFTAYAAITVSILFMKLLLNIFCMKLLLNIFCMKYSEITIRSLKIRDAAWHTDWVGAPSSFQRSVLFMIAVSKEFTLTAGKILPVSRRTFMMVSS
ncbi:hypothetical protein C0J52_05332, partial [Blattella germanica]